MLLAGASDAGREPMRISPDYELVPVYRRFTVTTRIEVLTLRQRRCRQGLWYLCAYGKRMTSAMPFDGVRFSQCGAWRASFFVWQFFVDNTGRHLGVSVI